MSSSATKIETQYVLDAHSLIWYLTGNKKLSSRARDVFRAAERGETQLVVSAIVVAELYFADKKWSLFADFAQEYTALTQRPEFQFVPLCMPKMFLNSTATPPCRKCTTASSQAWPAASVLPFSPPIR